ncbi:MAG: hypothetical protein RBR08_15150 [Desulforegulaceae bacterium]|nr:hypothetical protein [Desulforegulaceae bacterium]
MESHLKKIDELLKNWSDTVLEDAKKLLASGMIDTASFNDAEYALAKIILTAAIKRNEDNYAPPYYAKSYRKEVKNLISV